MLDSFFCIHLPLLLLTHFDCRCYWRRVVKHIHNIASVHMSCIFFFFASRFSFFLHSLSLLFTLHLCNIKGKMPHAIRVLCRWNQHFQCGVVVVVVVDDVIGGWKKESEMYTHYILHVVVVIVVVYKKLMIDSENKFWKN